MFKRMLPMSLGLAFLAGMTGATFGSSTAKAETQIAFATAAAQSGGTYSYNTEAKALQAAGYFRDQGRIVLGPYYINGHWEIVVSD